MAYSSKHPKFDDVIFKDNGLAGSVPNPASGSDKIVNRGGNFFSRSSTGAEKPLGGGGGELNVFTDTDGIGATWVASGAGVTVANTTTTSEIALYPIKTTAIKLTNVSGTDYVRGRFTMPAGLQSKKLKIEFYQAALAGYVDGDNKVEIYTNTASNYGGTYTKLPLSTDVSGVSALQNRTGKFTTYFDSDDLLYYEVRIVRVSGTAAITFGGIIVGPGIQPQGAVITEWQSYTPTFTGVGTPTGVAFKYRRNGSNLEVSGIFEVDTPSGASAAAFSLPAGLNIDTTGLTTNRKAFGDWHQLFSGGGDIFGSTATGVCYYSGGAGTNAVRLADQMAGLDYLVAVASTFLTAGNPVDIPLLVIPIAEWAGSGVLQLAENAVEYAFNTDLTNANDLTSFGYGPQGTQFGNFSGGGPTKRFRFQSPIQKGDKIEFEVSANSGAVWQTLESNNIVSPYQAQGGTGYGVLMDVVAGSDTDMDVTFGNHRVANPATFGAAGSDWSTIDNDPQFLWRVKKTSANAALGFAEASSEATGLAGPSGTWVPGDQGSTNISSLANLKGYYSKVGKIVTCVVTVDIDAISAAFASAVINVPIAANFTATDQAIGVGTNIFDKNVGTVSSVNGSNNVSLDFTAVVLTATNWMWSFQYEVQ